MEKTIKEKEKLDILFICNSLDLGGAEKIMYEIIKSIGNYNKEIIKIKKATHLGTLMGLEVHAGHGLTYKSAKILSKVRGIKEFNIGHFLIGESIFVGLDKTIKKFRKIIS